MQRYDLRIDANVAASVDASKTSISSAESASLRAALSPATHSWTVEAVDKVGNRAPAPARSVKMDDAAPQFAALPVVSPAPGTWVGVATPTLMWLPPTDAASQVASQAVGVDRGAPINMNPDFSNPIAGCDVGSLRSGTCFANGWSVRTWSGGWSQSYAGRTGVAALLMYTRALDPVVNYAFVKQHLTLPDVPLRLETSVNVGKPTFGGHTHFTVEVASSGQAYTLFDDNYVFVDTGWHDVEVGLSSFRNRAADVTVGCSGSIAPDFGNPCGVDSAQIVPFLHAYEDLGPGANSLTIPDALPDGQHEWQILATDGAGNVGSTATFHFGTDITPPNRFHLSAAGTADGAYVSIPTPNLCWGNAVDPPPGSGVAGYRLYVDGALHRDSVAVSQTPCAQPSVLPATLAEGEHSWYAVAFDVVGNTSQSLETWKFTYDITAPTSFMLLSPADGATVADPLPTFSWEASSDAVSGLAGYEVWVDGGAEGQCAPCTVGPDQTNFTAVNPLSVGLHSWFVKALDRAGHKTQSAIRSFGVLPTSTPSVSDTPTASSTPTITVTRTATAAPTATASPTTTATPTASPTITASTTATASATHSDTLTPSSTASATGTVSATATATGTATTTSLPSTTSTPTATPSPPPTSTPPPCVGDCDTSNTVTIDELVRGVRIALGIMALDLCPAFDCDGSGSASIHCIIGAVNASLNGCTT